MSSFGDLRLKPDALARLGLPDMAFPVRTDYLEEALVEGDMPLAAMLFGLQQRSRQVSAGWQDLEPAMARLAELLAPPDERPLTSARGDDWWLEIGPVDLCGCIVTVQRGDTLLAALSAREDGRLRVAVFRPLDGKSAEYLTSLGQLPQSPDGVGMGGGTNWEYALDASAGTGNAYANQFGSAYLSYWEHGLGRAWDGEVAGWMAQRSLVARRPDVVATELGVHYLLSEEQAPPEDPE